MSHKEMYPEEVRRAVRETAEKISNSHAFIAIFNEKMIEEVYPLVEMGAAVYMDKPIYLIVPKSQAHLLTENIKRLARAVEVFDDTLEPALRDSAIEAAASRLLTAVMKPKEDRGMFLCDKCHDATAHPDFFRSRGTCESCGETANCIDCHIAPCTVRKDGDDEVETLSQ